MPKRILLVEDQHDTAELLTMALEMSGHEVTCADTKASAVSAGKQADFDVLVCDIGLPDGSGLDVMRELSGKNIKGIALTGFGREEDVQECKAAGFDVHLTKPVDIDALEAVVNGI